MLRLAILALLAGLLYFLLRSYFPKEPGENNARISLEMEQDPNCKLYVAKTEAITRIIAGKTHYFCGEKCALEFSRKAGG